MRTNTTIAVLLPTTGRVSGIHDDQDQKAKDQDHDYIIERQQDYRVQGPPTTVSLTVAANGRLPPARRKHRRVR